MFLVAKGVLYAAKRATLEIAKLDTQGGCLGHRAVSIRHVMNSATTLDTTTMTAMSTTLMEGRAFYRPVLWAYPNIDRPCSDPFAVAQHRVGAV